MALLQGMGRQICQTTISSHRPSWGAQRLRSPRHSSCKAAAVRLDLGRSVCREQATALRPLPGKRTTGLTCRASALPDQPEPVAPPTNQLGSTLYLGVLFLGWYGFNITFNLANKTVLKAVPLPFTSTAVQLATGSLMSLTMWALNLHERPKINKDLLLSVLPLAIVHTLGNLLTNVSLGKVAVSFTHTIKATEPFFTVMLSALFLGDTPSPAVLATLVPIVGGVAAASFSEATFNWPGFLAAMGSNVTFQSRNVFSKKFMGKGKNSLDNINLFSLITIMSFFLMVPFSLAREGFHFTPGALRAMGVADPSFILRQILYAAISFHTYQQVSYMILEKVSPVTHSVGNCLKRVVVIVASILFFKNPMPQQNIIGTGIALLGVFAYSQVKRQAGKQAATVKPAI